MSNISEIIFQLIAAVIFAGAITFLGVMSNAGTFMNYTTDIKSRQRQEIAEGYDDTLEKDIIESKEEVYFDIISTIKQETPLKTAFYIGGTAVTPEMVKSVKNAGYSEDLMKFINDNAPSSGEYLKSYNVSTDENGNSSFNAIIYEPAS